MAKLQYSVTVVFDSDPSNPKQVDEKLDQLKALGEIRAVKAKSVKDTPAK